MSPFVQEIWGPQGAGIPTAPRTDLEVQLEILKALRALQHGEESYGDDPLGGPDGVLPGMGEFGPSGRGEHRKLEGIRRLRRRWLLHPHLIIQEYLYLVRERLGVVADTSPWHMKQYSTQIRPQFGKCTGLWRVHHLLQEALDLICLRGDMAHGVALLVQGSKAVHQAAMDSGSWTTGALLVPTVDPVSPPRFAGTAQELASAASYKEGIAALHLSGDAPTAPVTADASGSEQPRPQKGKSAAAKAAAAAARTRREEGGEKGDKR